MPYRNNNHPSDSPSWGRRGLDSLRNLGAQSCSTLGLFARSTANNSSQADKDDPNTATTSSPSASLQYSTPNESLDLEHTFRHIAVSDAEKLATSVLTPQTVYFIGIETTDKRILSSGIGLEAPKENTYIVWTVTTIYAELIDAFAKAAALDFQKQSVDRGPKYVVGIADTRFLAHDSYGSLSCFKRCLGGTADERSLSTGLLWRNVPKEAIQGVLPWPCIAGGCVVREWFPWLDVEDWVASFFPEGKVGSEDVRTMWLSRKRVSLDVVPLKIFDGLWSIFGMSANEEVTRGLASVFRAWSFGHAENEAQVPFEVQLKDDVEREIKAILKRQKDFLGVEGKKVCMELFAEVNRTVLGGG